MRQHTYSGISSGGGQRRNSVSIVDLGREAYTYKVTIRQAIPGDIRQVCHLEKTIEGANAASKRILSQRLRLFPEGFYVAVNDNGRIVGYVESCKWNLENFEQFEQIKNFRKFHTEAGKTLYVIFLAIDPRYRRKGIGSKLTEALCDYAKARNLRKVQLVSSRELVKFYGNMGFKASRILPDFHDHTDGVLMEKTL